MLLYMHYFFIGQPRAMNREVCTIDHGRAVIEPWAHRLSELGVRLRRNQPARGLHFEKGRALGLIDSEERFDKVILATDIPGTQAIVAHSQASDGVTAPALARLRQRVEPLKVAPPYKVLRVWFDRPLLSSRPDVLETPQHRPINLVAQFHLLEEESRAWAEKSGGSVLEFHLYANPLWATIRDEDVWRAIRPVALELFNELQKARVLAQIVGSHENFTSFEVGQGRLRPFSDTPLHLGLKNLFFAGDWVQTSYPSALMERAVSTGREAANHILEADNVRQVPLKVTSSEGPGLL
jgi:isorenieratene synthase